MRPDSTPEQKLTKALQSAQATCLLFGMCLLVWGLAPAIIERVTTGRSPSFDTMAPTLATLALGAAFLVLGVLIGRSAWWAVWSALCISLALMTGTLITAAYVGFRSASAFALLLPACAAGTCWLVLDARRAQRRNAPAGPEA